MADRDRDLAVPIADSYWVQPGLLLAGEYPGAYREDHARERLDRFVRAGIRSFIDLTEETEPLSPYHFLLGDLGGVNVSDCRHQRYAIRDAGVPAKALLETILRTMKQEVAAARPVYVHCWGGIGRTGTVIGCWLVEQGMTGKEALQRIAELRRGVPDAYISSPETEAQRQCIINWVKRGDT